MPVVLLAGGVLLLVFLLRQNASASADVSSGDPTVSSGNKLSASDIAQYAQAAGFSGSDLTTAVAIALAESGGYTGSYNPVTHLDSGKVANTPQGLGDIGLWQIYAKVHPEFDPAQLTDPAYNASAAFSIYSKAGNNFHPWTTFTTGAYRANLNLAADAVASISGTETPDQANLTPAGNCGNCCATCSGEGS